MDAGIADTINRRDVQLIVAQLDSIDAGLRDGTPGAAWYRSDWGPWHLAPIASTLLCEGPATAADRAWLVGTLAARTPGVNFDGNPAECDWENLFAHFRAEILSRRDPQTPSVHVAETPVRDGVGSR